MDGYLTSERSLPSETTFSVFLSGGAREYFLPSLRRLVGPAEAYINAVASPGFGARGRGANLNLGESKDLRVVAHKISIQ